MDKKRAWVFLVAGVGLFALIAGLVLWRRADVGEEQAVRYNERAQHLQAKRYARDELAGRPAVPGCSAGARYQAAVEACALAPDPAKRDQAQAFTQRLGPPPPAPGAGTSKPPNPDALPKACEALGLTHDPLDPAQPWLTEELCAELARCAKPLDELAEATRCEDARGPFSIYDPWTLDPQQGTPENPAQRPLLGFVYAGRLLAARLWVWSEAGQRERALAALPEALRYARDLGAGGTLLGVMIGLAAQEPASRWLRAQLEADALSEAEARALLRELGALRGRAEQRADAFMGEYLYFMPLFLGDSPKLARPPATPMFSAQGGTWWERMLVRQGASEMVPLWDKLLEAQAQPLPARLAIYDQVEQALQRSRNPLLQVVGVEYGRYDVKVEVADAQLELLRLALADAALRKASPGAKPTSVEALRALWPAPADLSAEWVFSLEDDAQGRRLCAKLNLSHPSAALPNGEDRPCVALPEQ